MPTDLKTAIQSFFSNKRNVIITAGIMVFLLAFILLVIFSFSKNPAGTPKTSQEKAEEGARGGIVRPFPKVNVEVWSVPPNVSAKSSSSAQIYTLKNNYTRSDFQSILAKFIGNATVTEDEKALTAQTSTDKTSSFLYLQKPTGAFLYMAAKGGVVLPQAQQTVGQTQPTQKDLVVRFVQSVFSDRTFSLTAEYKRKNQPGIRFFEFHRGWEAAGLPILNLYGLFSTGEKVSLSSLKLGVPLRGIMKDENVIDTSDGADGYARPTDFNTVTVGVVGTEVQSVASNIRNINVAPPVRQSLITFDQAVARLKKHQYSQIYVRPAGDGTVDPDKLYPDGEAKLAEVTVQDGVVAYLEEMPGTVQSKLAPYYIFRGMGDLTSGYKVSVLAAVPATEQAVLGAATSIVLAQATATDSTQKQGTIEFATPTPTQPPPPPVQAPVGDTKYVIPSTGPIIPSCTNATQGIHNPNISVVDGVRNLDLTGIPIQTDTNGNQYFVNHNDLFVIPKTTDISQLQQTISTGLGYLPSQTITSSPGNFVLPTVPSGGTGKIDMQYITANLNRTGGGCPIPITGYSPTLFVYSDMPRSFTVSPNFGLTYRDPALLNRAWSVRVGGKGLNINGVNRPYIYYEYDPSILFSKPASGWIIDRRDIGGFAERIAKRLNLTLQEKERVEYEINNSAQSVGSDTLFVGLIPQNEIEEKLPLAISEQPGSVHRIHFYVSSAQKEEVSSPKFMPLVRTSFMILEIGAQFGD